MLCARGAAEVDNLFDLEILWETLLRAVLGYEERDELLKALLGSGVGAWGPHNCLCLDWTFDWTLDWMLDWTWARVVDN